MKTAHLFLQIGLVLASIGFVGFVALVVNDHLHQQRRRRDQQAWRQSGGGRL